MRTIAVLNAKGGSGKTTIATNLAGYYASKGREVALFDLDPQGSSMDWLAARPNERPTIHGIAVFDGAPARAPRNTEIGIIDAPAGTWGPDLTAALKRAETVLVPVVPSAIDIRAAERFLGELASLRKVSGGNVKIAAIANRVRENTRVAGELEEYLDSLRLPSGRKMPFLSTLRANRCYLRSAETGLSIFEFAPSATFDDRRTWTPLLRWLGSARSRPA